MGRTSDGKQFLDSLPGWCFCRRGRAPVPSFMEKLEAESAGKMILIINGAGHGQASDKEPKRFWRTIRRFIAGHTDWDEDE